MATPETLQDVIATLLGADPADIHPDVAFAGTRLQGSLARTRLYMAIEQQLGVACQAAYTARTYGELHAAIYSTALGRHYAPGADITTDTRAECAKQRGRTEYSLWH